jgi:hypothetical protein
MSLMRLAYASEATFEPKPVEQGVEPHVARILMTSRRNNGRCDLPALAREAVFEPFCWMKRCL